MFATSLQGSGAWQYFVKVYTFLPIQKIVHGHRTCVLTLKI